MTKFGIQRVSSENLEVASDLCWVPAKFDPPPSPPPEDKQYHIKVSELSHTTKLLTDLKVQTILICRTEILSSP